MDEAVKPYPLITQAIRDGNVDQVANLFRQYPEMQNLQVPAFGTWLHYAAAHGSRSVTHWFIEFGYQLASKRNAEQTTPLVEAAQRGREENV